MAILESSPPSFSRPVGLATLGCDSHFAEPFRIGSPHRIHIGRDVWIGPRAHLSAVEEIGDNHYEPTIRIGDGCHIAEDFILHCAGEVDLGSRVLIAARAYVGDSFREYENWREHRGDTPYAEAKPIKIQDGAFIGVGAAVLPGVTIGEGAIIAANAVVTRTVPPRSVALGNPARVIRSWDKKAGRWIAGPAGNR